MSHVLEEERIRTILLTMGVVANIALLGYFKYRNFFLDSLNSIFSTHFSFTNLLLPLGISFLTFQKIGFLADVYSRQVKSVHLSDFLLFTLFFPRTIAGPIVRYNSIVPQFENVAHVSRRADLTVGICLFSIGLFKKAVIADNIGQFVPTTFDVTQWNQEPDLFTAWCGVFAYAFQLYFDFSGYSDMALGAARMLGIRLPMNFNSPFKAASIIEFWGRWHITLTNFLTAYIYTPIVLNFTRKRLARGQPVLQGKRSTATSIVSLVALPTLITMILSGLWHGAGWQFVLWGALHGVYLTINQSWRILRARFWPPGWDYERIMKPVGCVLTFIAVMVAFVFFRAPTVSSAFSILGGLVGLNGFESYYPELLKNFGIAVPTSLMRVLKMEIISPWFWIGILLLIVTLLPNSLELLRKFQPAQDFPMDFGAISSKQTIHSTSKVHTLFARFDQLTREGVSLNYLTALATALLCFLGILAINSGSTFLYGQF
jgi:D-alanyl-lipoteichoic acid acyltransferase DltB (MBOAT superfamily)